MQKPPNRYTIEPRALKECDLVEAALTKADIAFSVELRYDKPPLYITYSIPEQALRNEGFLVWGSRFKLVCRIRHMLREEKNV